MPPIRENLADFIPHRPPMHWIDRAWIAPDGTFHAVRTITPDHSLLEGNLLPSSALIEMLAQTAACGAGFAARQKNGPIPGGRLVAIKSMSFGTPVHAGETVEMSVRTLRQWQSLFMCELLATVKAQMAALGTASFALID